jgi:D-alanyl-D-alanine carboxypeptidase (penicillin-binding protein 5/6)
MIIVKLMRGVKLTFLAIALVIIIYCVWVFVRPISPIQPTLINTETIQTAVNLSWPSQGQSAVGIVNSPILVTNKPETPSPTASTAKLITALTVLKIKPLTLNEQGPIITLGPSDVQIYKNYVAAQGSVVPVAAGEKITEYQMLQAMMLPSANNMADSLAIWAYGSLQNYTQAATDYLKSLGLNDTHISTDASGFAPGTTSTASDLVKIGETAISNPVLASIVGQPTATDIPLVASAKNVNYLLGTNNIIGIKTGNTDQAGGVYISASRITLDGQNLTIVTANIGASTLGQAVSGSLPLIQSAQKNVVVQSPVTAGSVVGYYLPPWDKEKINITTNSNVATLIWKGDSLNLSKNIISINKSLAPGSVVGTVKSFGNGVIYSSKVNLVTTSAINKPSIWWRLSHPNFT